MAKRLPASMRTRDSLSDLIEGRLSSAGGRAEPVKLAPDLSSRRRWRPRSDPAQTPIATA